MRKQFIILHYYILCFGELVANLFDFAQFHPRFSEEKISMKVLTLSGTILTMGYRYSSPKFNMH